MKILWAILLTLVAAVEQADEIGSRVIKGRTVDYKEFPFFGVLVRRSQLNGGDHISSICGVSLISSRYFLSAAHCFGETKVEPDPFLYVIAMGVSNRCDPQGYEHIYTLKKIIMHPNYRDVIYSHDHDIVVMKSKREVLDYIPVRLPLCPSYPDQEGLAIGLGQWRVADASIPAENPCQLQAADERVLAAKQCTNDGHRTYTINGHAFCAIGKLNNDTTICFGDSGGPFLVEIESGHPEILGIVSTTGTKCLARRWLNSFTEVYSYLPWIQEVTGQIGNWI